MEVGWRWAARVPARLSAMASTTCSTCGADIPDRYRRVRVVRHAARGGAGGRRDHPLRDGRQLRPEGVDRARRASRSGDAARGPDPVLRRDARGLRVARRHDREDHRRRHRRGLRPAGPSRRRRAARGRGGRREPARAGDPQRPARGDLGRAPRGPDRRRDRGRHLRRGEHRPARPDRRHDDHLVGDGAERAAAGGPHRRLHLRARPRHGRGRARRSGHPEGLAGVAGGVSPDLGRGASRGGARRGRHGRRGDAPVPGLRRGEPGGLPALRDVRRGARRGDAAGRHPQDGHARVRRPEAGDPRRHDARARRPCATS